MVYLPPPPGKPTPRFRLSRPAVPKPELDWRRGAHGQGRPSGDFIWLPGLKVIMPLRNQRRLLFVSCCPAPSAALLPDSSATSSWWRRLRFIPSAFWHSGALRGIMRQVPRHTARVMEAHAAVLHPIRLSAFKLENFFTPSIFKVGAVLLTFAVAMNPRKCCEMLVTVHHRHRGLEHLPAETSDAAVRRISSHNCPVPASGQRHRYA